MYYIRNIISQVRANAEVTGEQRCDCNYSDNYYGDRVCRPLPATDK